MPTSFLKSFLSSNFSKFNFLLVSGRKLDHRGLRHVTDTVAKKEIVFIEWYLDIFEWLIIFILVEISENVENARESGFTRNFADVLHS